MAKGLKYVVLLMFGLIFLGIATNSYANSVLASTGGQYLGYGYGNYYWNNITAALNSATGNNVYTTADFSNLSQMLTYDAIWLDIRDTSSLLSATELSNISSFLGTGRRAVLIGENLP